MDTTENNKILMAFMGVKPKSERDGVYSYSNLPYYSIRENDIDKVLDGMAEHLKYHSDWSLLMEVVEKIEELEYNVKIEYATCVIINSDDDFKMIIGNGGENYSKIEAVYNACIEFINWHNQQKN